MEKVKLPQGKKKSWISVPKQVVHDIYSPCNGEINPLNSLKDDVFSKGLLGDGLVIDCNDGVIRAPISGTMVLTTPYKHAYGIMNGTGSAVFVHVGTDSVKLEGYGLTSLVQKGQVVHQGDMIAKFDPKYIKQKGIDHRIVVLITRDSKHKITKKTSNKSVTYNDVLLELE